MEKIILEVPEKLKEKLTNKSIETGFNSVEEYIIYVFNQVTGEDECEEEAYSKEEEKAMKERLKGLGYL